MNEERPTIGGIDFHRLPQPIGELCRLYGNLKEENPSEKISRLKEIFEVVIKLLCTIVVKTYLTESEKYQAEKAILSINKRIEELTKPALGRWVGLLRETVLFFSRDKYRTPEIISPIVEFYASRLAGGKSSFVFESARIIGDFLGHDPGKPTVLSLCDFLSSVRNYLSSGGHGASLNEVDAAKAADELEVIIAWLVGQLTFLEDFSLFYVDQVKKSGGKTLYEVKSFSHHAVVHQKCTQKENVKSEICVDREVYFALAESRNTATPIIKNAVSLHPLVIFRHCTTTKTEQLFILNGIGKKTLNYLCYATGAIYKSPEFIQGFGDILKVIRGEIAASDIFRPINPGDPHISSFEERKRAEDAANEALFLVKQEAPDLALKKVEESLRLSIYCVSAYFVRGLACCATGDLPASLAAFKKSADLLPDKVVYLLACALTLMADDKIDQSLEFFRKVKKYDSGSQYARQALEDPEEFSGQLFKDVRSVEQRLETVKEIVIQQYENDQLEITSWLFRLPPWKQIYKLSKRSRYPVPPLLTSMFLAFLLFVVVTGIHWKLFMLWAIKETGETISCVSFSPILQPVETRMLMARFAIISTIIFLGLEYAFLFNALIKQIYQRLGTLVLMPRNAYRHWFMSETSRIWGSSNACASITNSDNKCDFSQLLTSDKRLFWSFVGVCVFFLPIQYYNAGDWQPFLPYPSKLGSALKTGAAPLVSIGNTWAFIQFMVRHAIYYLEVYLCAWGATFIFPFFFLFPRIARLPIRYYPGIPASMTLRAVSSVFIYFAVAGAFFCALVIVQLFLFDCLSVAPVPAIIYLLSICIILPVYFFLPPTGFYLVMNRLKIKVIEEFSSNLEKSYKGCLSRPDQKCFDSLRQEAVFLKKLKKFCPVSPLSLLHALLATGVLLLLFLLIGLYMYGSITLGMPHF